MNRFTPNDPILKNIFFAICLLLLTFFLFIISYPSLALPHPNIQNNKTRMLRDNYYKENRIQNTKIISLFRFHLLIYSLYRSITTFPIPLSSVPLSKSRQAAVHFSRLQYSHPSLEPPPCFHRLHEPHSSCIHTI